MRTVALLVALVSAASSAQGARFAVHPLELREMTAAQQELVQAQFDVLLAKVPSIRLAGSTLVEEALRKPAGKDCETRDACLRFLAKETESLYAVYARLRPDPLGAQLLLNARVIRSDGAVMRQVELGAPLGEKGELTETARQLLARLLDRLELKALSATLAVEPVAPIVPLARAEVVPPPAVIVSSRRPAGLALLGTGAVTLGAGAIVAGLAVGGRSQLTLDPHGAVPQSQANRALGVAREGQVATVLIPVGAVVALLGAAVAFWPRGDAVAVSMLRPASRTGFQGRWP